MSNRTDYYQKGLDTAVYGYTYIPDFDSKEHEREFLRGYKEGKEREAKRVAKLTAMSPQAMITALTSLNSAVKWIIANENDSSPANANQLWLNRYTIELRDACDLLGLDANEVLTFNRNRLQSR